jgi:hypothetical protein
VRTRAPTSAPNDVVRSVASDAERVAETGERAVVFDLSGVNYSFRFVDADGGSRFVKFHWKPAQGLQSVVWNEAVKINGADPDFHRRDLWDAISMGDFPEWELHVQVFDDEFADSSEFDVLDVTKIIPEELVPVTRIGRMVLDRVVDNFFAATEQVAFCTQNVVPGIDFTNDPLLQGRNFSDLDTQLKRLGVGEVHVTDETFAYSWSVELALPAYRRCARTGGAIVLRWPEQPRWRVEC